MAPFIRGLMGGDCFPAEAGLVQTCRRKCDRRNMRWTLYSGHASVRNWAMTLRQGREKSPLPLPKLLL